jgi:hypothetical protein
MHKLLNTLSRSESSDNLCRLGSSMSALFLTIFLLDLSLHSFVILDGATREVDYNSVAELARNFFQ